MSYGECCTYIAGMKGELDTDAHWYNKCSGWYCTKLQAYQSHETEQLDCDHPKNKYLRREKIIDNKFKLSKTILNPFDY